VAKIKSVIYGEATMSKYEVGIMSSKWVIEAPSLDIAVVTLRLAQRTSAPIVCYNTPMQSRFMMVDNYADETLKNFLDTNADEVRIAYRTMELVT
jgi:hypothetical protein